MCIHIMVSTNIEPRMIANRSRNLQYTFTFTIDRPSKIKATIGLRSHSFMYKNVWATTRAQSYVSDRMNVFPFPPLRRPSLQQPTTRRCKAKIKKTLKDKKKATKSTWKATNSQSRNETARWFVRHNLRRTFRRRHGSSASTRLA